MKIYGDYCHISVSPPDEIGLFVPSQEFPITLKRSFRSSTTAFRVPPTIPFVTSMVYIDKKLFQNNPNTNVSFLTKNNQKSMAVENFIRIGTSFFLREVRWWARSVCNLTQQTE
jgi:hypothetical protein